MSSNINVYIEEGLSKGPPPASSNVADDSSHNNLGRLKEHDYIGLSEVSSSIESSVVSCDGEENNMHLKETELRLGLPGSLSHARDSSELNLLSPLNIRTEVEEKNLFPVEKHQHSTKDGVVEEKNGQDKYNIQPSGMGRNMMTVSPKSIVTGSKRGFSEAMESRNCFPDSRNNGFSTEGKWVFPAQVGGVIVAGSEVELPKTNTQGKFLPQGLASAPSASTTTSQEESKDVEELKFSPFTRVGRCLDGKPSTSSGRSETISHLTNNKTSGPGSSLGTSQRRPSGKLVFGSGTGNIPADASDASKATVKEVKQEVPKEEPKFWAFTSKNIR